MQEQPSAKVARLAQGRWAAIFLRLAPELAAAIDKAPVIGRRPQHVRCPVHGGKHNDGFRFFRDFRQTGGGICNTCDSFPTGVQLLSWVKGISYTDTLKMLLDVLDGQGVNIPAPQPRTPSETQEQARRQWREDLRLARAIRKIWRESLSLSHPRAEAGRLYFARRGLAIYRNDRVLRFHPRLYYRLEGQIIGHYPALVFRVCDASGRSVTLHRIYLDADGEKAPVPKPKKLMSYPTGLRRLSGGAIRLVPAGRALGVAEGPETALAIIQATGSPVWSAVSDTLMRQVVIPPGVERVAAWLDKDVSRAGQRAGQALCERLWREGLHAGAVVPRLEIAPGKKSVDWLDVWNRIGQTGFPQSLIDPQVKCRRVAS